MVKYDLFMSRISGRLNTGEYVSRASNSQGPRISFHGNLGPPSTLHTAVDLPRTTGESYKFSRLARTTR